MELLVRFQSCVFFFCGDRYLLVRYFKNLHVNDNSCDLRNSKGSFGLWIDEEVSVVRGGNKLLSQVEWRGVGHLIG